MSLKYVQNVGDLLIRCKVEIEFNGETHIKAFNFPRKKIDTMQGTLINTGYTAVTEEDLELLKKSSGTFQHFIKQKKLLVHDVLPLHAQTPQEITAGLARENAELKAKVMELENVSDVKKYTDRIAVLEKAAKDGDKALLATNKELSLELRALQEKHDALLKAVKRGDTDLSAFETAVEQDIEGKK